jgi:predicted nucleotidyltransferase component of viral defense system
MLSTRECIECFHLVFLRALATRGEDKARIVLKGGSNLRFYFGSIRYSDDIDFDVSSLARETLKNKVDKLLQSPAIASPLRMMDLEVVEVSAPKQTDTTQRWKLGLRHPGSSAVTRTKLEFSRRTASTMTGAQLGAVSTQLSAHYGVSAVLAMHYERGAAICQKIAALAGRTEPQARDVFDLSLLFASSETPTLDSHTKQALARAIENALSISYDDYASTVIGYLDPEQARPYEGRAAWDQMQESVLVRLLALR